jgi:hypothetical protein
VMMAILMMETVVILHVMLKKDTAALEDLQLPQILVLKFAVMVRI